MSSSYDPVTLARTGPVFAVPEQFVMVSQSLPEQFVRGFSSLFLSPFLTQRLPAALVGQTQHTAGSGPGPVWRNKI